MKIGVPAVNAKHNGPAFDLVHIPRQAESPEDSRRIQQASLYVEDWVDRAPSEIEIIGFAIASGAAVLAFAGGLGYALFRLGSRFIG